MAEENVKRWYVVRTAGGKEKKAKEYIEKEVEARNLGNVLTQVLIPTEKYYQIKNGKRVSAERILYSGYVLVECVLTPEILALIPSLPNVAGFLSEGKDKDNRTPTPIGEDEMNRILGNVDALAGADEETLVPFVVGEAVKVIDGPFNGFDGDVEEIMDDKRKVKVMVKIFGRKTLLELNFAQVTKNI